MPYHFYILYSKTADRYYTGHTGNLNERLRKHNTNHRGYTGKFDDWIIVYTEEFPLKNDAYHRELEVKKKKSRKYIENLIDSD